MWLSMCVLCLQLIDGSSIAELISSHTEKQTRISERVVRELMLTISHALYYIHKKKNITHRDLTPSNIVLTSDHDPLSAQTRQKAILVDFGLARQRQTEMSVMASVVGTLTYVPLPSEGLDPSSLLFLVQVSLAQLSLLACASDPSRGQKCRCMYTGILALSSSSASLTQTRQIYGRWA